GRALVGEIVDVALARDVVRDRARDLLAGHRHDVAAAAQTVQGHAQRVGGQDVEGRGDVDDQVGDVHERAADVDVPDAGGGDRAGRAGLAEGGEDVDAVHLHGEAGRADLGNGDDH